jgi:hypothetical protein
MSLVTSIKDSIEILNNFYDSNFENLNTVELVSQLVLIIFANIRSVFIYILTFQWFRDFSYLPILVPNGISSILQENFVLEGSDAALMSQNFSLLEAPSFSSNKFLIGFLNSFFLILPISCAHFITIRRLLIQGIPAGVSSAIGTIFGQLCFITCILFGIRGFLIPWVALEPVTYIIGFFLVTSIVYEMAHERAIRLIPFSHKKQLFNIFGLNFALAWTEQACIFQYFGNLSINPEPSLLEIAFGAVRRSNFGFLTQQSCFYLVGILVGSIVFSVLFGMTILVISNFLSVRICIFGRVSTSFLIQRLNFSLLILIFALSLTSLPYYGIDYLLGGPLGFISQDTAFEGTVFSRTTLKNYKLVGFAEKKPGATVLKVRPNTDISLFDRGDYLPRVVAKPVSFEQLNYGDTKLWLNRFKRSKSFFRFKQDKAKRARERFFKKLHNTQLIQWNVDGYKLKQLKVMQQQVKALRAQEEKLNTLRASTQKSNSPLLQEGGTAALTNVPSGQRDPFGAEGPGEEQKVDPLDSGPFRAATQAEAEENSINDRYAPLYDSSFEDAHAYKRNDDIKYFDEPGEAEIVLEDGSFATEENKRLAKISGDELIEQRFPEQKIARLQQEKFQRLQARTFNTGFFSSNQTLKPKIGKEFTQKQYYLSPIYRLLLKTDIDTFIRRQPKTHSLTIAQENQLFEKRLALSDYYNSLRYYMELPYVNAFQDAFQGSKSYADRVFNHQFKGTLKTVRRLFAVNLAENQPLITVGPKGAPGPEGHTFSKRVLKYDQPLFNDAEGPEGQNFLLHEELKKPADQQQMLSSSPFLSLTNSQPVYAGWDNQQRKLVITNRYLPTSLAGVEMGSEAYIKCPEDPKGLVRDQKNLAVGTAPSDEATLHYLLRTILNSKTKLEFTTWPISKQILEDPKTKQAVTYKLLFELKKDPRNQIEPWKSIFELPISLDDAQLLADLKKKGISFDYNTLPASIKRSNLSPTVKSRFLAQELLPPGRGGFIWPGTEKLKFDPFGPSGLLGRGLGKQT